MKNKILTILGTRPELIKMFPVVKKLDKHFNNKLIWSGQHYDFELVENIFKDISLRKPDQIIKINKKKNNFFQLQKKIYSIIKKSKPTNYSTMKNKKVTVVVAEIKSKRSPHRSKNFSFVESMCSSFSDKCVHSI